MSCARIICVTGTTFVVHVTVAARRNTSLLPSILRLSMTSGIWHVGICATELGRVEFVMMKNASMGMKGIVKLVLEEFETF